MEREGLIGCLTIDGLTIPYFGAAGPSAVGPVHLHGGEMMNSDPIVARRRAKQSAAACMLSALATTASLTSASGASTPVDSQRAMLEHVALAVAAYKASADQCYYDPKDGRIFDDADALFTRRLPEVWPRLLASAPDSLPALRNTAHLLGATSDCVALGNAVGLGLIAALYTGQLDASVGAEMDRLTKGGGRGVSDPAPAGLPAPPPRSAAETAKAMHEANPSAGMPAPYHPSDIGAGYATQGQRLVERPPQPMVGPNLNAPADGQPVPPPPARVQEAASGVAQEPALSECLQAVDSGHNRNEEFAKCYSTALTREDNRLADEYATLKGRIYNPGKTSALTLAQRTWMDFRDRWCAYEVSLDEAASPEVARLSCLVGLTSDQADRLATSYLP